MGRNKEKTIDEKTGETTSFYLQNHQDKNLESAGMDGMQQSEAVNKAIEDAATFAELREAKIRELRSKLADLKDELDRWEIDPGEVGRWETA